MLTREQLNPQVHWIITLLLWINASDYKDTYHLSGGLLCRVDGSVKHYVYKERVISSNDCVLYCGGTRFECCRKISC